MPEKTDYEPLTEAVFLILVTLAHEDLHGYAIMQEVEAISGGRVCFSTGTLYGAIKRLLQRGWITRLESTDEAEVTGRPKKVYRLTPLGREILTAEAQRMEQLATLAARRLQAGPA